MLIVAFSSGVEGASTKIILWAARGADKLSRILFNKG